MDSEPEPSQSAGRRDAGHVDLTPAAASDGTGGGRLSRRRLLVSASGALLASAGGCLNVASSEEPDTLAVEWITDKPDSYEGNHHDLATARVDGDLRIAVPQNGLDGSDQCGVVTYDGIGTEVWRQQLPSEHCNAHAVGDIGVGDLTASGGPEFFTPTESGDVVGYDARGGDERFRAAVIESIGFSAPVVARLGQSDEPVLLVADFEGPLSAIAANGSVLKSVSVERPVYVHPMVADVTGDGAANVVVSHGAYPNEVVCYDREWAVEWVAEQEQATRSWIRFERDAGSAIATLDGNTVRALDGADGSLAWSTDVGDDLTEAHVGGADDRQLYVSAPDATLRALDVETGEIRWAEGIGGDESRMAPPAVGSVAGTESSSGSSRGSSTVVAVGYGGTVTAFDDSGELLGRRDLDTDLYTQPVPVDLTGSGTEEVLVLFGDARVAALSFEQP